MPPTYRFFWAKKKSWMNFGPLIDRSWSHQDLGVVGLPGAFRLSCHHQHAGRQDSFLAKQQIGSGMVTG